MKMVEKAIIVIEYFSISEVGNHHHYPSDFFNANLISLRANH